MESLLAHIARKERHRLRVVQVDVDERREIAEKLSVAEAPTLVLLRGKRLLARIEGRASAPRIEQMLDEHLEPDAAVAAA
jgi:thioredoxin-like negative regulator of GroEL